MSLLGKAFCEDSPKFNEKIVKGFTTSELKHAGEWIDRAIRCMQSSLPEGLRFEGSESCSPLDQYLVMTRPRSSKKRYGRQYECAQSTLKVRRYKWSYNGTPLSPRYLHIPYALPFNIITIRGVKFVASPVVADNLISVENDKIFIPITRSRLIFHRSPYHFFCDGQTLTVDLHTSELHNISSALQPSVKPCLMNYLFSFYGVTETFKKMFHADVKVGEPGDFDDLGDDWVLCKSKTYYSTRRGNSARGTHYELAIKRKHLRQGTKSAIAGFFYILDNTSASAFVNLKEMDNKSLWQRLLMRFTWKEYDEVSNFEQVKSHLESLKYYVDDLVKQKLRHENMKVDNILDLMVFIIESHSELAAKINPADVSGKVLTILPFLLFSIVKMMFTLMYQLNKLKERRLHKEGIERTFNTHWYETVGVKIAEVDSVTTLDSATPCAAFKTTIMTLSQAKRGKGDNSTEMNNPAFALHPTTSSIYGVLNMTKADPSGAGRLNLFAELDDYNRVVLREDMLPLIENKAKLMS